MPTKISEWRGCHAEDKPW